MTTPSAETRTRLGLDVMVMGWSGPGSFMVFCLFRSARCDHADAIQRLCKVWIGNIVRQRVTEKGVHDKFCRTLGGARGSAAVRRTPDLETHRHADGCPRYP